MCMIVCLRACVCMYNGPRCSEKKSSCLLILKAFDARARGALCVCVQRMDKIYIAQKSVSRV